MFCSHCFTCWSIYKAIKLFSYVTIIPPVILPPPSTKKSNSNNNLWWMRFNLLFYCSFVVLYYVFFLCWMCFDAIGGCVLRYRHLNRNFIAFTSTTGHNVEDVSYQFHTSNYDYKNLLIHPFCIIVDSSLRSFSTDFWFIIVISLWKWRGITDVYCLYGYAFCFLDEWKISMTIHFCDMSCMWNWVAKMEFLKSSLKASGRKCGLATILLIAVFLMNS